MDSEEAQVELGVVEDFQDARVFANFEHVVQSFVVGENVQDANCTSSIYLG